MNDRYDFVSKYVGDRWNFESQYCRQALAVILPIFKNGAHLTNQEIISKMFRAYPFGERAYYPYAQWCKVQKLFKDALKEYGKQQSGAKLVEQQSIADSLINNLKTID